MRLLIRCGLPLDHLRVEAARGWIEKNFSVSRNPGVFAADREELRDAYYFYYCWSFAHAMQALGQRELRTPAGVVQWPKELTAELRRRQNADGSWTNSFTDGKENDPLVATPLAVAALIIANGGM